MAAQPSVPTIRRARLTCVAGIAFFSHRWATPAIGVQELWRLPYYRQVYKRLHGGTAAGPLAQAWRPRQRSQFWSYYLGGQPLGGVAAETAYDAIVPFRLLDPAPPVISITDGGERIALDVYGYPNGIVLALSLDMIDAAGVTLDGWRDRARRLRLDSVYGVSIGGGPISSPRTAQRLCDDLLARYRERFYGPAAEGWASNEVFTVHGVVQGSGVDPVAPASDDILRHLDAVSAWPMAGQVDAMPVLSDPTVGLPAAARNRCPGDVHLAARRGRAIWRPGLFGYQRSPSEKPTHVLGCFLHNLVAATVQAEVLRLFAVGYAHSAAARSNLDQAEAANTARLLNDLLLGTATYRSASVREQLRDSSSRAEVSALLTAHGFAAVS